MNTNDPMRQQHMINFMSAFDKLLDLIEEKDNVFHPAVVRQAKKCAVLRDKERKITTANKRKPSLKRTAVR